RSIWGLSARRKRRPSMRCRAGCWRRIWLTRAMASLMFPGRFQSQTLNSYFSESAYSSLEGKARFSQSSKPLYMPHDGEGGTAAALEPFGQDVGGVDEEVGAEILARGAEGEFGEVVGQLLLGVAPGEVGVGLGEAELGQPLHGLGTGEGLGEKDHIGI